MKSSERNRIADEVRCRQKYEVELAQGASHIASMLYPHTLRDAVQETVRAFADRHGREELRVSSPRWLPSWNIAGVTMLCRYFNALRSARTPPDSTSTSQHSGPRGRLPSTKPRCDPPLNAARDEQKGPRRSR
jgi:hypothetical protein